MRALLFSILALALLGIAGLVWFSESTGPAEKVPPLAVTPTGIQPRVSTAAKGDQDELLRPVDGGASAVEAEAWIAEPASLAQSSGSGLLDGIVLDRFAQPMARERVFLLRAGQKHPSSGADLADYVTARTSSTGEFSLALADAGPWSFSVGPPGEPRIKPSSPALVRAGTKVEATVAGTCALRVIFDEMPSASEKITLELITLREDGGGKSRRGLRDDLGRSQGDDGSTTGNPPRGNRGSAGDRGDGGGRNRGRRGRSRAPTETGGGAGAIMIAALSPQGQDGAAKRDGNEKDAKKRDRNRSERGGQKKDPEGKQAPKLVDIPGPPPQVWRTFASHVIEGQELTTRTVDLQRVPTGATVKLALKIGKRRIEGSESVLLVPDFRVIVRVLPVSSSPDAMLVYVTTLVPVSADARKPGVRWLK